MSRKKIGKHNFIFPIQINLSILLQKSPKNFRAIIIVFTTFTHVGDTGFEPVTSAM